MNHIENYHDRVAACWLGKAGGGGIGTPYEGVPHPLKLTENDLYIDDSPNDDLELQLLWLLYAEKYGSALTSGHLAHAWRNQIQYGLDEYGIAVWNLKRGLEAPYTGLADNWFIDGLGAAIRAEIWACLYPGKPQMAGYFAAQDAMIDHWGDGVWAEVFLAAAESIAFACGDVKAALQGGLRHIPPGSRVSRAVGYVFDLYHTGVRPEELRSRIMAHSGSHNFTDCVMNLGFMTAALLYGEEDFVDTILHAVNFGMDCDCVAATCGAFLGIARGGNVIPEHILNKISRTISVSPFMEKIPGVPRDFESLTERVVGLARKLNSTPCGEPDLPLYTPAELPADKKPTRNSWLVLDESEYPEFEQLRNTLLKTKACPEALQCKIMDADSIHLDLDGHIRNFNTLHLFTFLHSREIGDNPLLMACANTGITVWIDGKMVLNYHGRQNILPAFHRTEGGASFYYPFRAGEKHLVHVRLIFARKPLRLSVAVADGDHHIVKDFSLRI